MSDPTAPTSARTRDLRHPILTVDVVLLTVREGLLHVGLLNRSAEPEKGRAALVGGYVRGNEDVDADAAAVRVLKDKAGLSDIYIEQLQTFAGRDRDPRGWSASIAYLAIVPEERFSGTSLLIRPADDPGDLPFDHNKIVSTATGRLRGKGVYSTLPARLLPEEFTLPEMVAVYAAVTGERLDQSSFRRKIMELGALEPVPDGMRKTSIVRRPAQLYRLARPMAVFDKRL